MCSIINGIKIIFYATVVFSTDKNIYFMYAYLSLKSENGIFSLYFQMLEQL